MMHHGLKKLLSVFLGTFFAILISAGYSEEEKMDLDINYSKPSIGSYMEIGQIVSGQNDEDSLVDVSGELINRSGVIIVEEVTIEDWIKVKIGVGGLFWYAYPVTTANPFDNGLKFGPGISEASLTLSFSKDNPNNFLRVGFFPMKYNSEASNLGEYMYRSGLSPGFVWTGGWSIIGSAAYMAQGAQVQFEMLDGMLKHNFTLFMERDFAPFFDFTPSYMLDVKIGPMEIGTGISFHHLLAKKSRLEQKDVDAATFVEFTSFPEIPTLIDTLTGSTGIDIFDTTQNYNPAGYISGLKNSLSRLKDTKADDDPNNTYDPDKVNPFNLKYWIDTSGGGSIKRTPVDAGWDKRTHVETNEFVYPRKEFFFNHRGIKLMGRISLDFKEILGDPSWAKPGDLKVFAEAVVLGLEDRPFFYENIKNRIPLMFGINLPGFKIFDSFSLQAEYYSNPFKENIWMLLKTQTAVWKVEDDNAFKNEPFHDDDWKWSMLVTKELVPGMKISAQVASDHLRPIQKNALPGDIPFSNSPTDWHYMFKLEFGI